MNQIQTILSVSSLEKSFKGVKVLKGVDFAISKGSIFTLLGSNGAGKTTTVKILSTLIKPDGGKAQICGYDVVSQGMKVREQISLTGQYAAVDEVLTGRENLCMIGALNHLPDYHKKADEMLEAFDLVNAGKRRVSTYSGGMRRRLDLAMSLLGKPSVIFLDEPTTGLDPQSRLAMWKIIKSLADSGTTVFLTTQYLEEAEQLADHIAILHDGVIVAEGTPDALKKRIPQGTVELAFYTEHEMQKAMALLKEYEVQNKKEMLTINVMTDGSVEQLTALLNCITDSGVSVSSFTQKLPTLEEVFLRLVNEKKETIK